MRRIAAPVQAVEVKDLVHLQHHDEQADGATNDLLDVDLLVA